MRVLRYLIAYLLIPVAFAAVLLGGVWSLALPLFVFGLVPVAEALLPQQTANLTPEHEKQLARQGRYDLALYLAIPAQYGLIAALLWRVGAGGFGVWEWAGALASVGICCGSFGINVAHELGHRRERLPQLGAQALLLTSLYLHFFIEHNRGHHVRVATHEDPASSRLNENLYRFWWRSVSGSFRSAWRLEAERLTRRKKSPWSLSNQMLRFQLIQIAALVLVGLVSGPWGLAAFVCVAVMGALLLETVNYVEHYGLSRQRNARGHYERVQPIHSWNSDHPLGRLLLFELTRHADHHAHPRRHFQVLRHFPEAPQLPLGYPGSLLLAACPPLWFKVMNPRVAALSQPVAPHAAASAA